MTPEELYLANEKLAYWILAKYYPAFQTDEDYQQTAKIGLWKACLGYKEDAQIKFSSYASRCILNEICNYFRDSGQTSRDGVSSLSLDVQINDDDTTLANLIPGDKDVLFIDFNGFWESLTSREKKIVAMLMQGLTNREIGNSIGVSNQRISEIRLKAKQKFLNYI